GDPVAGESPPLVAEATAECSHPEPVLARVPGAYPAHQLIPRVVVDRVEYRLGHSVPEVVRPPSVLRGSAPAAEGESSRLRTARPGPPPQEQRDQTRLRPRRRLRAIPAEPHLPQKRIRDRHDGQVLIQNRPVPRPGRQPHRKSPHP